MKKQKPFDIEKLSDIIIPEELFFDYMDLFYSLFLDIKNTYLNKQEVINIMEKQKPFDIKKLSDIIIPEELFFDYMDFSKNDILKNFKNRNKISLLQLMEKEDLFPLNKHNECVIFDKYKKECNGCSVGSHSISKSQNLEPIASKTQKKVYKIDTNNSFYSQHHNEGMYFLEIPISKASVFPGFCSNHENLFLNIDHGINILNDEDVYWAYYREIMFYYLKINKNPIKLAYLYNLINILILKTKYYDYKFENLKHNLYFSFNMHLIKKYLQNKKNKTPNKKSNKNRTMTLNLRDLINQYFLKKRFTYSLKIMRNLSNHFFEEYYKETNRLKGIEKNIKKLNDNIDFNKKIKKNLLYIKHFEYEGILPFLASGTLSINPKQSDESKHFYITVSINNKNNSLITLSCFSDNLEAISEIDLICKQPSVLNTVFKLSFHLENCYYNIDFIDSDETIKNKLKHYYNQDSRIRFTQNYYDKEYLKHFDDMLIPFDFVKIENTLKNKY